MSSETFGHAPIDGYDGEWYCPRCTVPPGYLHSGYLVVWPCAAATVLGIADQEPGESS